MNDLPSVDSSYADLEDPYDFQNVPRYRGGNRVTRNRLNPVAKSPVARVTKAVIKAPIRAGRVGGGRGGATSGDGGYWNLVIAECLLLFILYIIAHNELQTWADIIFWRPAAPVQVGTAAPGSQALGGALAGGAASAGVTALTPGGTPQLNTFLGLPWGGATNPSNFLNNAIDGGTNAVNRQASSGANSIINNMLQRIVPTSWFQSWQAKGWILAPNAVAPPPPAAPGK